MANEPQLTTRWVRKSDAPDVYSNFVFLNWSMTDVRIRFGQLLPSDDGGPVSEDRAAVTVSWSTAKLLCDLLADAVRRFEQANGEIKPLKLP